MQVKIDHDRRDLARLLPGAPGRSRRIDATRRPGRGAERGIADKSQPSLRLPEHRAGIRTKSGAPAWRPFCDKPWTQPPISGAAFMQRLHVFVRWLLGFVRTLPTAIGGSNVYSKAWEDRGFPGDGV
jgi:hypothetical protein